MRSIGNAMNLYTALTIGLIAFSFVIGYLTGRMQAFVEMEQMTRQWIAYIKAEGDYDS